MLALNEAIKIAELERKSKVAGASDCGDRWAFGFEDDRDKTDGIPLFVYKADGKCEYFSVGQFMYDLIDGNIICTPLKITSLNETTPH